MGQDGMGQDGTAMLQVGAAAAAGASAPRLVAPQGCAGARLPLAPLARCVPPALALPLGLCQGGCKRPWALGVGGRWQGRGRPGWTQRPGRDRHRGPAAGQALPTGLRGCSPALRRPDPGADSAPHPDGSPKPCGISLHPRGRGAAPPPHPQRGSRYPMGGCEGQGHRGPGSPLSRGVGSLPPGGVHLRGGCVQWGDHAQLRGVGTPGALHTRGGAHSGDHVRGGCAHSGAVHTWGGGQYAPGHPGGGAMHSGGSCAKWGGACIAGAGMHTRGPCIYGGCASRDGGRVHWGSCAHGGGSCTPRGGVCARWGWVHTGGCAHWGGAVHTGE